MAILRNQATRRRIYLKALHVFGRARSSDTLLENLDASQLHASVKWTGTAWELSDHSRNGTWLDGVRQSHVSGLALGVGSSLCFGGQDEVAWVVEDIAPPGALLWPLGHDSHPITLQNFNVLPQDSNAEISIHRTEQGQWIGTTPQGSQMLEDGDEISIAGHTWCLVTPTQAAATVEGFPHVSMRPRMSLHFNVSLDEEHVYLRVQEAERQIDLGERSHHYTLLTLARLRLEDARRHWDSHAHGWVEFDRLAKMLGVEPGHLNIQIFRLRKQLAQALAGGAPVPELIERRRGSLRFGGLRFHIMRGAMLEACFDPLLQSHPVRSNSPLAA